jgi:ribosomal silencing factor RsfS
MTIEWSLNLGTLVGILFAAAGFYFITRADLKALNDSMIDVKRNLEKLQDVITTQAVATKRIERLEDDVRNLARGRGFIQEQINGEYPRR